MTRRATPTAKADRLSKFQWEKFSLMLHKASIEEPEIFSSGAVLYGFFGK
jgi:hypothetical protein